jgi:EAL domain-containing protein (putative c-di-GMP-specific phosphodiesterase class I)
LGYLRSLPLDVLKVDRSFVHNATTNADDAALVMAIITLAHSLRLEVIAEGVETEEHLQFLKLLRCDEGQGYLFARAMPADQFRMWLKESSGEALAVPTRQQPSAGTAKLARVFAAGDTNRIDEDETLYNRS